MDTSWPEHEGMTKNGVNWRQTTDHDLQLVNTRCNDVGTVANIRSGWRALTASCVSKSKCVISKDLLKQIGVLLAHDCISYFTRLTSLLY